ncbi:ABC transporter ATP-binding protein [Bacteroides caecimuris]|uniref:ABC transporter ATP-binding protein n=3 Tax=Bacteroidales TaxID=171549 RepID=UPI0026499A64|nr:ABC transporter ATP-binding protein [Bacteroides caecimuris]
MEKKETIKVVELSTGYHNKKGTTVITRDINASLYDGELTCLLGPNGAGKSTLLKTLTAFLTPVKGEIFIKQKPLRDYSDAELAKVIGVVLTEKLTINNMSVDELVGMGRSPYTGFWGHMSKYDRKIVDKSISLVGIIGLRGRMVQTLSDGERQKVMIAKTLAQETPIIFLDEPTAFLDYPSKVEIMQLLQTLAREQSKTVFLSTHDLELALQIADKIWLIDKTHGITIGTPEDLALNGDMSRYFHREGVIFDINSGLFKICHKLNKSVSLTGEGAEYNMVKKALARQGIAVTSAANAPIAIEATTDKIIVDGLTVKSIEDLIYLVNDTLNS